MSAQYDSLNAMTRIAESYVRLVLAVGLHDTDYVDAYYGPERWRVEVLSQKLSLDKILLAATRVLSDLDRIDMRAAKEMELLRHRYLSGQLHSLMSRVKLLQGTHMSFDEESQALYDAVAPSHSEDHFSTILRELDSLVPGSGPIPQRYHAFKDAFIIPLDKLDIVFRKAIEESRTRTAEFIPLPDGESFTVEYVTNKSWSGYNWYKGNSHSVIQMNTDLPIYIDRAIDLASHEGYPGHHVYNSLLEHHLVRGHRWMEFSVYPLFSPQSLIAEGAANYGIDVAFPKPERIAFEQAVLFPLAGMDPGAAQLYDDIHEIVLTLSYAGNEAARRYLDGAMSREEAIQWLVSYALMSPERAEQRTRFFDQYRSYVINYNLGQDLVKTYVEARGGTGDNPAKRWEVFHHLLSSPILPSGLR
jgi:hypothetical protein